MKGLTNLLYNLKRDEKGRLIMTEDVYQILRGMDLDEFDMETNSEQQEAYILYERKHHPENMEYFQCFSGD